MKKNSHISMLRIPKKILVAGMILVTAVALASCGNSSSSGASDSSSSSSSGSSDGKVLVAYFSASGNTEAVARDIAEATGGDIFEIQPQDAYTSDDLDWTDDNSRVNQEHDDESKRDIALVTTTPDNWDSYDVVFVGYPIWWGDAAWPVDNFVTGNDFSGKKVIPFCTSLSSGIGNSGSNLTSMAGTGDWQKGHRFSESPDKSDVQDWIDSLDI